jgi:hypothetical protein
MVTVTVRSYLPGEIARLVEHRDGALNQFGICAKNVVGRLRLRMKKELDKQTNRPKL